MIWCKGFPLWHLVISVIGLRVDVIWVDDRRWIIKSQSYWPETQLIEGYWEGDALCWKADWILTEDSQVPKMENVLCRAPVVLASFVCALLSFRAHDFPA